MAPTTPPTATSWRGEVVFVPAAPPRAGAFAVVGAPGGTGEVELIAPVGAGDSIRRVRRPARMVPVAEALPALLTLDPAAATPTAAAWATAARAGVGLVARGRLLPAIADDGSDAWRVGPLDGSDERYLRSLAAAFPPLAHSLPVPGSSPIRVASPAALIRQAWDAIADVLVRTAAAPAAVGQLAFAAGAPTAVGAWREWLTEAAAGPDAGARLALRLDLPSVDDTGARATLEVRSAADPSLVVEAAELWAAPAPVLARFGPRAEVDLLLGLRRGARAWPPLARLLAGSAPDSLVLDDDELVDLLSEAAEALAGAGIEVRWPADLLTGALELRATAGTPAPGPVTGAGFTMDALLGFRWQLALGGDPLTADELAALAEAKRPLVRLRGRWVRADPRMLARLREREQRRLTAVEALSAALTGTLEVDGDTVAFDAPAPIADLIARLDATAQPPPELPDLRAALRPYQERGVAWLAGMCASGLGGCLADDMGLGKTVQVIALHLHRRALRAGPTLVICPTTLLGNWERELARFAPGVPVRRFHGGARHLGGLAPDEVVLVTYGLLRRDRRALADIGWGLVVADEAQHVKNPLSRTARELRRVPAAARIALTGTPVENRLSDLWSILDWTTPGLLGPLDRFRREVAVPVERYRDPGATRRLGQLLRPFLLRRLKSDPAIAPELPAKTEVSQLVPLSAEQTTLYEAVVRETLAEIARAEGLGRRGLVFKLMTALKQICNHPAQYLHESGPLPRRSGKLAALDELVDIIVSEGDAVLVFTQYVEMGRLIVAHLAERGTGALFLHGSVPARRREQLVAAFQAGAAPVFVLSLKAAGVGLNLTRATRVIHYDRWWNPAVEDQATDRSYRIGQDRPVTVHRLVTEGTVEDKIDALLTGKRELADAVVGAGEAWLGELSDTELAELVRLAGPA